MITQEQVDAAVKRLRGVQDFPRSQQLVDDIELLISVAARAGMWAAGQPAYAVYHQAHGWLVDTCAGGTWSPSVAQAIWFPTTKVAIDTINEAELPCAEGLRYFVLQVH